MIPSISFLPGSHRTVEKSADERARGQAQAFIEAGLGDGLRRIPLRLLRLYLTAYRRSGKRNPVDWQPIAAAGLRA